MQFTRVLFLAGTAAVLLPLFMPIAAGQEKPAAAQTPRVVALRFATLVDGLGKSASDAVVVVDGERITRVGTGNDAVPRGGEVVDLRRYTAIPSLIDLHTHMSGSRWDPAAG